MTNPLHPEATENLTMGLVETMDILSGVGTVMRGGEELLLGIRYRLRRTDAGLAGELFVPHGQRDLVPIEPEGVVLRLEDERFIHFIVIRYAPVPDAPMEIRCLRQRPSGSFFWDETH